MVSWYAELPSKLLTFISSEMSNPFGNRRNSTSGFERLDESGWSDTLEMQHFGTFSCLYPTGKRQPGVGHNFQPVRFPSIAWCDKCGELIWGLFSQALRCSNCLYTCHHRCLNLVTLDCRSVSSDTLSSRSTELTRLSSHTFATGHSGIHVFDKESEQYDDDESWSSCNGEIFEADGYCIYDMPATGDKLLDLIESYNQKAAGLAMTMDNDGYSFRGFIRLLINFTRPVSTVDLCEESASSFYDLVNQASDTGSFSGRRRTLTSFYLPRNVVKTLHITSDTTTRELIISLLKKYHIADNPRKFALYERDVDTGATLQAKLKRVPEDACPLRIALVWGAKSSKRFVLQENETGDIIWESFEIPELTNFLAILDIEEKQNIRRICEYYKQYKKCLMEEISRKAKALYPAATVV